MAGYIRTSKCCNKEVRFERGQKPLLCPHCGTPYWDKPRDERELFQLQDTYIEQGRRSKDLEKLYFKALEYSENIVKGAIRGKAILSNEDLKEKGTDIATILLEAYLKDPEFIVQNSFGGLLIRYSKGVLYGDQEHDRTYSIDSEVGDGISIESSPLLYIQDPNLRDKYEHDVHDEYIKKTGKDLSTEVFEVILQIYQRLEQGETLSNRLKFLIGLENFLDLNKNSFMQEFYSFSGNRVKQHIENTKLVIRRYLINNQEG